MPSDWGMFMAAPGTKARDRLGCGHSEIEETKDETCGLLGHVAPPDTRTEPDRL